MEKIILFGNGQVASFTYYQFSQDSPYEVVAFTVDREYIGEDRLFHLPVVPFEEVERIYPPGEHKMFVSISFRNVNRLRAEKYAQAKAKGYELINSISPKANVWPGLVIGDNCTIGTFTSVQPFVQIGSDVTIAGGCTIGHNTVIGDHCFLSAGVVVSGSVTIGPYCFLGSGAVIRDRVHIARECVIGAGAVILEDTLERGVYLGKQADLLPVPSDRLPMG
jgi:sugar O-acyltransferase (sialic acid O-acetyltransferase NeuD family)